MKGKRKVYGLRKYWPHLSRKEAEAERDKLIKAQQGKCAICKKDEKAFKRKLSVDHNHKTGQVRGLLCFRCNKFIVGRHDITSVKRLLEYLQVEEQYV